MLFWENVILALNSLKSNKMRALLTMLGIIIGIGSVIAIFTVGNSVTLSVSTNLQDVGANDVYVSVVEKKEEEADKDAALDGLHFGTIGSSEEMEDKDYMTVDMIHDLCEEYQDDIYAISCSQNLSSTEVSVEGNDATKGDLKWPDPEQADSTDACQEQKDGRPPESDGQDTALL